MHRYGPHANANESPRSLAAANFRYKAQGFNPMTGQPLSCKQRDIDEQIPEGENNMDKRANVQPVLEEMRKVRQARQYRPEPVPQDVIEQLLELARWTGSSRNTQPWHFIVITDKEQLRQISQIRTPINWVAGAPLAIAIVLNGDNPVSEAYDEGRVTERILIGARLLGLGGGTAWYGDESLQAHAKQILGIPAEQTARSVVVLGYPTTIKDPRPGRVDGGRKPLSDIVSTGRYGSTASSS
jgi:nitroreductase